MRTGRFFSATTREIWRSGLANTIYDIHAMSRHSYGAPRVHAELRLGMGVRVGRKRVARLLRMTGRRGISHRHKRRHRPAEAVHQDLVQRKFVAAGPDLLWCTDITEHPTRGGKVYCAAVLDVFTRQVVGWSIADHMRSELVVDALQMATGSAKRVLRVLSTIRAMRCVGAGRYVLLLVI